MNQNTYANTYTPSEKDHTVLTRRFRQGNPCGHTLLDSPLLMRGLVLHGDRQSWQGCRRSRTKTLTQTLTHRFGTRTPSGAYEIHPFRLSLVPSRPGERRDG